MNSFEFFITIVFAAISIILLILNKNILQKISSDYQTIQKIHQDYVPPLGGLIIFIYFYSYLFFFFKQSNFFTNYHVLIPSLLIVTISSIEDLYNNIKPMVRFLVIFISSIFFCVINAELPIIELWRIGELINNNYLIRILFFSICLTALSNGMNMIDGMNGLSGLTSLNILAAIVALVLLFDIDKFDIQIFLILGGLLVVFLIFNFPFGKIFLGDAGAYWIGWLLGVIIIDLFNSPDLNTWAAALILFYPTMEVLFSTIRKLFLKKNPLLPDLNHLHLKLYFLLKGPIERNPKFNSFTTLCLMPFWICPVLTVVWIQYQSELAKYFLILFIFLYLIYYFLIPHPKNSK